MALVFFFLNAVCCLKTLQNIWEKHLVQMCLELKRFERLMLFVESGVRQQGNKVKETC